MVIPHGQKDTHETTMDAKAETAHWRNDPQFKELRQVGGKYATFATEGVAQ